MRPYAVHVPVPFGALRVPETVKAPFWSNVCKALTVSPLDMVSAPSNVMFVRLKVSAKVVPVMRAVLKMPLVMLKLPVWAFMSMLPEDNERFQGYAELAAFISFVPLNPNP